MIYPHKVHETDHKNFYMKSKVQQGDELVVKALGERSRVVLCNAA